MNEPLRKTLRFIEMALPGVRAARTYQGRWLRPDLIAGATIFAILIPQGMAYGELAGVAPVVGLYTALAALVGYAIFGSARQLMFGPEATSAILAATAVAPLAAGADPARYVTLTALLALLVGGVALAAGIARIGFLADFVSGPILIGFMIGAALIIISSQLGKLFGIKIGGDNFFLKIWELLKHLNQTSWLTLLIGLALIFFTSNVLTARTFAEKHGEKVDANQEFIALGAANILSSLIGGFSPAASQSRTVVNDEAGGKTQMVSVIVAALLVVFLLWFTPLLASLPQVALAAIIIAAALNLIDFKPLQEVW